MNTRSPIYPGMKVKVSPYNAEPGMFDSFQTPKTGETCTIKDLKVYADATYGVELVEHPGYWHAAKHFELVKDNTKKLTDQETKILKELGF